VRSRGRADSSDSCSDGEITSALELVIVVMGELPKAVTAPYRSVITLLVTPTAAGSEQSHAHRRPQQGFRKICSASPVPH